MLSRLFIILLLILVTSYPATSLADQRQDPREQAISDALDLWRDGRFGQLYDQLSHRSGMTKERFVEQFASSEARPACCHNKLNDFRLLNEKRTTARVFARIRMEGVAESHASQSREFSLDHENGQWKMRLTDIKSLAGQARSRKKHK